VRDSGGHIGGVTKGEAEEERRRRRDAGGETEEERRRERDRVIDKNREKTVGERQR
jgi:hypothetical protein